VNYCWPINRTAHRYRAFTVMEILLVVGIVIILVALIAPALSNAKESTRSMTCGSNQRQLMVGFMMFAKDHMGGLPGSEWDSLTTWPKDADAYKRDWMYGGTQDLKRAPQLGTIFPYVSGYADKNLYTFSSDYDSHYKIFLCPSYFVGAPPGSNYISNGHFDYTAFMLLSGARVSSVKPTARFKYANGNIVQGLITPVIVEEDPAWCGNANVEIGHSNLDQLGHIHFGGANYAGIDGSVQRFTEPMNCNSWNWYTPTPSGNWISMGNNGPAETWGWWNGQ